MKILYDDQIFTHQIYGGISKYYAQLLINLNAKQGISAELPNLYTLNQHLPESYSRRKPHYADSPFKLLRRIGRKKMERHNRQASLTALESDTWDIYHPTYYEEYPIPAAKKLKKVITIYDMIHERFPESFPPKDRTSHKKRQACMSADKILAISQSTKNDLVQLFSIAPEQIVVTHLAGSLQPTTEAERPLSSLPERYLLFVGKRTVYKNFQLLLDAASPLLLADRNLHLVCTGPAFSTDELTDFAQRNISHQLIHRLVNDAEFFRLYAHAQAFVFPSAYEGFGIPTLEAMSAGCPTILHHVSSLPEIGADAALYFHNHSVEELHAQLELVLNNPDLRQELARRGRKQASKYSWQRCADETLAAYQSLL